jgi:hypothetical protein
LALKRIENGSVKRGIWTMLGLGSDKNQRRDTIRHSGGHFKRTGASNRATDHNQTIAFHEA